VSHDIYYFEIPKIRKTKSTHAMPFQHEEIKDISKSIRLENAKGK
jgi:hypothetical protein